MKTINRSHLIIAVLVALSPTGRAAFQQENFSGGFLNGGAVPDGNPTGWFDTRTVGGMGSAPIADLSVRLNLSGGFNGDLYGYLSYGGQRVVILNRVGITASEPTGAFGYSDAGFDVVLSSSGLYDVHSYGSHGPIVVGDRLTGFWQPDGRNIDPLSSPATFDTATRLTFVDQFGGMDPNGKWTLFLADLSGGGGETRLLSWGLDITTKDVSVVPEPSTYIAGALCLLPFGLQAVRRLRNRK